MRRFVKVPLPPLSPRKNQVFINQFLYAVLREEKCAAAGVEIDNFDPRTFQLLDLVGYHSS